MASCSTCRPVASPRHTPARAPGRGLPACAVLLLGLALSSGVLAQAKVDVSACGSLKNHYGPYDYRTDGKHLPIVEQYHFTAEVENLVRGNTGYIAGDLTYTLRAFPNHHRALLALGRLSTKNAQGLAPGQDLSADCYFDRAIRWRRDDVVVYMLYADYLGKTKRPKDAVEQLKVAETLAADNPLTRHNLGLLYFDLGQYDLALAQAHQAMALGLTRTDLMDKLRGKGKWTPPPAEAAPPAAAAASAASAP